MCTLPSEEKKKYNNMQFSKQTRKRGNRFKEQTTEQLGQLSKDNQEKKKPAKFVESRNNVKNEAET